jgi:hypothetical protein
VLVTVTAAVLLDLRRSLAAAAFLLEGAISNYLLAKWNRCGGR